MTTTNEFDLLAKFKKEQEYTLKLGEALNRLVSNKDYQTVFNSYLFDTKLKQLVDELATTTAEPLVKKAQDNIRAIAVIKFLLKEILLTAKQAESNLAYDDEEILNYLRGN